MKGSSTGAALLVSSVTVLLLWLALGLGVWPLLAVSCVPLLVYVSRASRKQALFCALLTGVGHFLILLYWIVFVLGQYGGLPLFLSVPALLLLCLYMTVYLVAFVLLTRLFVHRFPVAVSIWLLPAAWVALDFLRSFFFSGFPWMDLGYGVAGLPVVFQSADLWGHYGLTFLIIQLNALFALALLNRTDMRMAARLAAPVCVLCVATLLYSGWRWQQVENSLVQAETLNVAVIQGNVAQGQKWDPAVKVRTVQGYIGQSLRLMRGTGSDFLRPDLIVWPETALPFFPRNNPLLTPIRRFIIDEQVMLLAGAPWYEEVEGGEEKYQLFNSSLLFDISGEIIARTSKSHLVPFGEYVPFKRFLPFIAPLVEAVGDFTPGEIRNPPACKTTRIGVLICFESIFGDISRKWVDAGASLLVNMTNDAWYGNSSAPYQTLAMTRLRAVETRRSIVRSANTGFSGFIDPMGRVQQVSPLFVPWQATEKVAIMDERTFFVRGGYLFAPACLVLACMGGLIALGRKNKKL